MMDPEQRLIQIADAGFAEAARRSAGWLQCGPGCGECCHRPFAITQADARRLRSAPLDEGIRERARSLWSRLKTDFPGEADSGTLTGNEEWREWFFRRWTGQACPALDPQTQACLVYAHRPVACRLAGPLIQAGTGTFPPCEKNYRGATPAQIEACRVVLDDPLFFEPATEPETVVAYALAVRD